VLLEETLSLLAPQPGEAFMVDCTTGEAGHSAAFLERFPGLKVRCIDADGEILRRAEERLAPYGGRALFYRGWMEDYFSAPPGDDPRPDVILMDLGISMFHYEESGRGVSFNRAEGLDMRIDPGRGRSAAEIIACTPERDLADILYNNGGERRSRQIAAAIVSARRLGKIETAAELARIIAGAVPPAYRRGPVHPATRSFMALRIAVNGELEGLSGRLAGALERLAPGGRLGVISFHSAEDRVVKLFFREKARDCSCPPQTPICKCGGPSLRIITPRGVAPGDDELRRNPPSRSARLRVVAKL
jgi:16S rRNA (cytosine1402-N4)-methyltransferase